MAKLRALHAQDTFRPAPSVVTREVGGELVLLDLAKNSYYGLDPVGARMWDLLTGGSALGLVVSIVLNEFDVDATTVRADVERLLNELLDQGLIVPSDESTTGSDVGIDTGS